MEVVRLLSIVSISFVSLVFLKALAPRIGLLDIPSERKIHHTETPLVGGIAIYIATFLSCILFFNIGSSTLQLFLLSCGLIVFLGGVDDYKNLGVPLRLVCQFLITSILVFYAGSYIHYLGNILGSGNIDLGSFGIFFTFVATLSLINAFNWTDGIDGLAGSLALNTFVSLGILFHLQGANELQLLPWILALCLLPFLLFNLGMVPGSQGKVFMGDAGSMFIGLGIIWLFILGSQGEQPSFRPVTAVWITAIPLWDLTSTVFRRLKAGRSPFKAGKDHLHHLCLALGLSQRQSLALIVLISILASSVAVAGEYFFIAEHIMLAIYVALFFIYSFGLGYLWKKAEKRDNES